MPLEERVNAQLVIELFEDGITEVFHADFVLGNFCLCIQDEFERFSSDRLFLCPFFSDFVEMGDGIAIDLFKLIQIAECLDIFLPNLAVLAVTVCQRE